MLLKPFPMGAPPGAMFGHQLPELLGVIHLFQMGEFVDDNVVNDRLRCHYQLPIEAKVALIGAATPAGPLASYEKSLIGEPQTSAQCACPLLHQLCGLYPVPLLHQ